VMDWQDFGVQDNAWKKTSPVGTTQAAAMIGLPEVPGDKLNKTARLEAWDPARQKRVWSRSVSGPEGGSVMATAGNLVFQGRMDGRFVAYAADSGEELWSFDAQAPVLAPPISFAVDGKQYVTVMTGNSGHSALFGADNRAFVTDYRTMPRRLLTFALGGEARLAPPARAIQSFPPDPDFRADPARHARGEMTFGMRCAICHGFLAEPGGFGPDLRRSGVVLDAAAFRDVVKQGALQQQGMPRFGEFDDASLDDLRHYIRARAEVARRSR
jgi:quinohemoprotein ethanol dehydrogenase